MHSGKGIVFSAPSETGKTTQARLWCERKRAELVNNDRPAVRIHGSEAYAYGTPWSGFGDECRNICAPVSAIVMLEQAPDNSICRIGGRQALQKLMPRCFLPYFDKSLMDGAISIIDSLIQKVPVYCLRCRPDYGSVDLVYNTIWNKVG
jgi:hypothetical protein